MPSHTKKSLEDQGELFILTIKDLEIGPCHVIPVTQRPVGNITGPNYTQEDESSDHMGEDEDSLIVYGIGYHLQWHVTNHVESTGQPSRDYSLGAAAANGDPSTSRP